MKRAILRAVWVLIPVGIVGAVLFRPVTEHAERSDHIESANFYPSDSPAHDAYAQFLAELYDFPQYQRAMSGATTPLAVHRLTHQFAMEGLGRLSDAELEEYMALRRAVWEQAPLELCAAYTRGDPRADNIQQTAVALGGLTREQVERYFELEAAAAKAEMTNSQPKIKLEEGEAAVAGSMFYSVMTPVERERFLAAMDDIGAVPDEEACWAGRLYNEMPFRSEGSARATVLRLLVQ